MLHPDTRQILLRLASDPCITPEVASMLRAQARSDDHDDAHANWVIVDPLGVRLTSVFAQSEAHALERAFAAEGCTARLERADDPLDLELRRCVCESWGRLD